MAARRYYSTRTGKNANARLDLPLLLRLFSDLYTAFEVKY